MRTVKLCVIGALALPFLAAPALAGPLDRWEDRIDRRESYIDRQTNNGVLDRIEDVVDRRESVRDRRGFDGPSAIDRHERRSWRRLRQGVES